MDKPYIFTVACVISRCKCLDLYFWPSLTGMGLVSFKVIFTQEYNTSKHQRREMSVRCGMFLKCYGFLMSPPIIFWSHLECQGVDVGGTWGFRSRSLCVSWFINWSTCNLSDVGFCLTLSASYITDSVALELWPNSIQRKFISHMHIHAKSIRQHTAHETFKLKSTTKDTNVWKHALATLNRTAPPYPRTLNLDISSFVPLIIQVHN